MTNFNETIPSKRRNLLYNPKLKEKARTLRENMTEFERKIWNEYLRNFKYKVFHIQ